MGRKRLGARAWLVTGFDGELVTWAISRSAARITAAHLVFDAYGSSLTMGEALAGFRAKRAPEYDGYRVVFGPHTSLFTIEEFVRDEAIDTVIDQRRDDKD